MIFLVAFKTAGLGFWGNSSFATIEPIADVVALVAITAVVAIAAVGIAVVGVLSFKIDENFSYSITKINFC